MRRMIWLLSVALAACAGEPAEPALLTVVHPGGGFDRTLTVEIDAEPAGVLGPGCELTLRLSPESHDVAVLWEGGEAARRLVPGPGEQVSLTLEPVGPALVVIDGRTRSEIALRPLEDCPVPGR